MGKRGFGSGHRAQGRSIKSQSSGMILMREYASSDDQIRALTWPLGGDMPMTPRSQLPA